MRTILHSIKLMIQTIAFSIFKLFPLNEYRILFESEGDFSDNAYAIFDYMKKNGFFTKYVPCWLVNDIEKGKKRDDCLCISKWGDGFDFKRLYYLATSKYYFFDHCNVMRGFQKRKDQLICNLFHGCTFKKTKGLVGEQKSPESILTITSDFWTHIMAEFVQCNENVVKSLGYPRNDYFFENNIATTKQWEERFQWIRFTKVFLWMPTFRRSDSGVLSENYYQGETGLPILEKESDLFELNKQLKKINTLIVFKVHHLQSDYDAFKKSYSNIQILKDEDIISCKTQLYQIVTLADALITDYSSISNDYLLLNRPIIFTLDDYEDYRNSRGFSVDDPAQYYPGHHVLNKKQLFAAINEISDGKDPFRDDRKRITQLMHKYQDGNSSKRIVEYIGL